MSEHQFARVMAAQHPTALRSRYARSLRRGVVLVFQSGFARAGGGHGRALGGTQIWTT